MATPVRHRIVRRTAGLALLAISLAGPACSATSGRADESTTTTAAGATTTTTSTPTGALTPIASIQIGQCLDEVGDETARSFVGAVLPCEEPHSLEVYDIQQYGGAKPPKAGTPYPGDLVVANAAEAQCATTFEAFIGLAWEASDFEIQAWWPTQQSWTQKADRQITCAVFKVTGDRVIGSARGIAA